MGLKIKQEHIDILRREITPFMNADTAQIYKDAGHGPLRYHWDALWSANKRSPEVQQCIREIYQYANDTHITSVLRMLAKEAEDAK